MTSLQLHAEPMPCHVHCAPLYHAFQSVHARRPSCFPRLSTNVFER